MGNQPIRQNQPSGGWGILVPLLLAIGFIVWPYCVWHGCKYGGQDLSGCGAQSEWVWNARSWAACGIWWGFLASFVVPAAVTAVGKRRPAPPKGRLRVEATTPGQLRPPPPASIVVPRPPCYHLDAVPVDLSTGERVAWWCEACQTQLDGDFGRLMRPCCGSAPGTFHVYNCPHLKG